MFEVRQAGAKGLGVFAKTIIPRGTRVFSERPVLFIRADQDAGDIYTSSLLLSPSGRTEILALSDINTSPFLRWTQVLWYTAKQLPNSVAASLRDKGKPLPFPNLREHNKVLNIFRTNAFATDTSLVHQAVFPKIARLNHSCVPNAQGNFHEGLGRFNVHATRDIAAEEELTISYLAEHGAGRVQRQAGLKNYGFECGCGACDFSTLQGRDGEERRVNMQSVLKAFAESKGSAGIKGELETLEKYIGLFEGEGLAGRELSTMYFEAAKLNEKMDKMDEALRCAEEGLRIDRDILGDDHVLYERGVEVVQELKMKTQQKT